MGNCQAAEAATVVIQHPGNKIERIYWSVSARQVMDSNPGHYVGHVIHSSNHFKLLRPTDTLLIGQLYRLISFQDVLKEFAAKKSVKLGKLLKDRAALGFEMKHKDLSNPNPSTAKVERGGEVHGMRSSSSSKKKKKGSGGGGQQWRPALQSIAEFGT
ncbi:hypothetical protein HN51_006640 [Arachis hypogaea]|uniref:Uncharacterized protein LOC107487644 n=1 Tax=Arachis duranensis TaxID=130453 RepID=A0A6P4DA85_ARADU|nr:uncharacterized protein LOC107487644 [Arachis duranensis]XP_025698562.1 uncharacterized protein LOC112800477 [Arachis hypogaea]QHO40599.1 DUF4228 domain protein [Arachis hypogaea]